MKPRQYPFSIIVACYNGEKYLDECLESLIRQNYGPDLFEVVCVDDGSNDSSPRIIQNFKNRFQNFTVVTLQNSGLEKACNAGIRSAKFSHIVRVDADDRIDLNFLSKMNQAMLKNPEYDFYYCKNYIEYYSEEKKYAKELPEFKQEEIFERGDFFATGTVYRKSDLVEIGLFPEGEKNCGLENYFVILSLLSRGKKGFPVAGASFDYRRHETNMSTVKQVAIIEYGKKLLMSYGRKFQTNQFHPYGLRI